ncbi:hypothetical protein [Marinomonas sp. TW1]|uniref:hypothetical protein n=1 Tax=Marinomonas sp. TW1 TaxID=1561203 RepID=UPI0007AFD6B9|nr:hypothetical protein [Marinomonas sp. TW1]KZN13645.1 hypothetical protein OA79_09785 [Marinomonas sp. TW1]
MKKILLSSLATAAVTLSTGTYAESLFTYLDYGFGKVDVSSSDDGYTSLSGAFETSAGPYVAFESTEYGSLDVMAVGAGMYSGVGSQSNIFGQLQYVQVDIGRNDETGFRITAGVRTTISDRVELEGKFKYDDVFSDTDSSFAVAARYYVTKNFSVAANYDTAEIAGYNYDAMFASLRLSF